MKSSKVNLKTLVLAFLPINLFLLSNLAFSNSDTNYEYNSYNNYYENNLNNDPSEVQVLHVNSDAISGSYDIKAVVDEYFNITQFRTYVNGNLKGQYSPDTFSNGVVLLKKDGYNVIKLSSTDFSPDFNTCTENRIDMTYLSDGISNSYDDFYMRLIPEGNHWALHKDTGNDTTEFTTMFLKGRKFMGQVVGIQSIRTY